MKVKAYLFTDPTGGGDDAVLLLPESFDPGGILRVYAGDEDEHGPVEMQGIGDGVEIDRETYEEIRNEAEDEAGL